MTQPLRIPFVEPLENRDQTLTSDRKMVNALAEQSQGGAVRLLKRPGNRQAYQGTVGTGQGITNYLNSLYAISGDTLNGFSSGANLVATLATGTASWQQREGHMFVGFNGKLWVMGGWVQPSVAAPTFTATINGSGVVNSVVISTAGVGYAPGYPLTVNLSFSGGGGSGATATVTMSGQSAVSVNLAAGGSGYSSPPSVSISTTAGWGVMNDVWNSVDGINWSQVTGAAPWAQRGRGGVVIFNNKMWVMGGGTGTGANANDRIYGDVWSTSDGITWTQNSASAWPGRRRFGLTVFNNLMWVAGGAALSANNNNWPQTLYSDVYYSADGVAWTKTADHAPWVARSDFAFYGINGLLYVTGGNLTDPFSTATTDQWSSPDGIVWTRVSSNPFGVAASGVWPIAALNSMGMDYPIPPPVSVNNTGTGGTGATAWCFSDYDDDGDADDLQAGPLVQLTFSAVGSGYTKAPALSLGTTVGVEGGAYAFLDGTSNSGAKMFRVAQLGSTIYLLEFKDGATNVHTVWGTTDGVTFTNLAVDFTAGWVPRTGEWTAYGKLWLAGGISTVPTYYNDVWFINISGSSNALGPNVPLGFYHFSQTSTSIATPLLVFKSTKDLYSYNASLNILTKLSNSANYPATTVPGIVYLDGVFYVMDTKGQIYNSGTNDPATWTALGKIAMQNEPNGGAAIAKMANFVMGFGQWTTEFFYDNANPPPSSPLSPNQTLPIQVGCAAGESTIEMQNSIVWIGQTRREGQGVYMFNGYVPQRISTPFVDRIIQNDPLSSVRAYSLDMFGHACYVLNLQTSAVTLVYDFTTGMWSIFTSLTAQGTTAVSSLTCDPYGLVTVVDPSHGYSDGDPIVISGAVVAGYNGSFNATAVDSNTFTYLVPAALAANPGTATAQGFSSSAFNPVASAQVLDIDYVQDPTNGAIYAQALFYYTDNGTPVDMQAVTDRVDMQTSKWKFLTRLSLVADMVASNVLLGYSDTDYQSWSTYRNLVMNQGQRPTVTPGGRFRRRAFRIRHTAATPLRIEALELDVTVGDN